MLNLKQFLPYQLSVLEQLISQQIARRYEGKYELNRMQWRVLASIAMFKDSSASDICQFTHMDKMQVSRAIKGLVEMGWIHQDKCPTDQRKTVLNLTAKGRKNYARIIPEVLDEQENIFSAFTFEERQSFRQLIDKLSIAIEEKLASTSPD